jgi:hypothetical protein
VTLGDQPLAQRPPDQLFVVNDQNSGKRHAAEV